MFCGANKPGLQSAACFKVRPTNQKTAHATDKGPPSRSESKPQSFVLLLNQDSPRDHMSRLKKSARSRCLSVKVRFRVLRRLRTKSRAYR